MLNVPLNPSRSIIMPDVDHNVLWFINYVIFCLLFCFSSGMSRFAAFVVWEITVDSYCRQCVHYNCRRCSLQCEYPGGGFFVAYSVCILTYLTCVRTGYEKVSLWTSFENVVRQVDLNSIWMEPWHTVQNKFRITCMWFSVWFFGSVEILFCLDVPAVFFFCKYR